MPELPEVETARRGIAPRIIGRRVTSVAVRQPALRFPVPDALAHDARGAEVLRVERRAKYLLVRTSRGTILLHLGMSGSLCFVPARTRPGPHEHVDLRFSGDVCLRLRDPRRFGAVLWTTEEPSEHRLLRHLGPEPLDDAFDGEYLRAVACGRSVAIKNLVMNAQVVVGVGNIYASEALFGAGVSPRRRASRVTRRSCDAIAASIKRVLAEAITRGGTTLRDFASADGVEGGYRQKLLVYGREGEPCVRCAGVVKRVVLGQRSTFYCPSCQR